MSELMDIAKAVAEPLARFYDIDVLYSDTEPVGHSGVVVDPYTMMPSYIEIGCASSDVGDSEKVFAQDVCSLVISVFHEFRHMEQLDAILDDEYELSGVVPSRQAAICESYVSTARHVGYYDEYYRSLPHEIDAERFGTRFGCNWIDKQFGSDFLCEGLRSRMSHMRQDVYPVSLAKALVNLSAGWIEGLLSVKFEISSTKFGTGSYRDLLNQDVGAGILSPSVRDSVVRRRARTCLTKDLSFLTEGGLSKQSPLSYVEERGLE